jgi:hypothetical protein
MRIVVVCGAIFGCRWYGLPGIDHRVPALRLNRPSRGIQRGVTWTVVPSLATAYKADTVAVVCSARGHVHFSGATSEGRPWTTRERRSPVG